MPNAQRVGWIVMRLNPSKNGNYNRERTLTCSVHIGVHQPCYGEARESAISKSLGHFLPVTNSRSCSAS